MLCPLSGTFQQRRQQFVDRKTARFDAHRSHSIPRKNVLKTIHSASAVLPVLVPSTSNENQPFTFTVHQVCQRFVQLCSNNSANEEFAESTNARSTRIRITSFAYDRRGFTLAAAQLPGVNVPKWTETLHQMQNPVIYSFEKKKWISCGNVFILWRAPSN